MLDLVFRVQHVEYDLDIYLDELSTTTVLEAQVSTLAQNLLPPIKLLSFEVNYTLFWMRTTDEIV
jgi:hypothetical protein